MLDTPRDGRSVAVWLSLKLSTGGAGGGLPSRMVLGVVGLHEGHGSARIRLSAARKGRYCTVRRA